MTVSRALRGSELVSREVRERVEKMASKLGYVRNPLAGALMSEMRRSCSRAFQGVLAVLDIDGPSGRTPGPASYHAELATGAIDRARAMGFSADQITMGEGGMSVERVDAIMQARGIRGVFILPARQEPELGRLDWANYSGIYADFLLEHPSLHTICTDHYRAVLTALQRLRALGYRRPGLMLNAFHNARLLHRQEAAYQVFLANHSDLTFVPPLLRWRVKEADFREWFSLSGCDVVLTNITEALGWMRKEGARVPETHGFCALNAINPAEPCAGLDLQPRLIGERGMEMLIGMVLRNERGAPEHPVHSALPARWVDGPTIRNMLRPGAAAPADAVWRWGPPANRKTGEFPEEVSPAATYRRKKARA